MAHQIIKQPNGKYCIFDSIVDNIIFYNMLEEEIIEELVKDAKVKITEEVKGIISKLNEGKKPYFQFTMNYEQMIHSINVIHGEEVSEEVRKTIEK